MSLFENYSLSRFKSQTTFEIPRFKSTICIIQTCPSFFWRGTGSSTIALWIPTEAFLMQAQKKPLWLPPWHFWLTVKWLCFFFCSPFSSWQPWRAVGIRSGPLACTRRRPPRRRSPGCGRRGGGPWTHLDMLNSNRSNIKIYEDTVFRSVICIRTRFLISWISQEDIFLTSF